MYSVSIPMSPNAIGVIQSHKDGKLLIALPSYNWLNFEAEANTSLPEFSIGKRIDVVLIKES